MFNYGIYFSYGETMKVLERFYYGTASFFESYAPSTSCILLKLLNPPRQALESRDYNSHFI